MGCVTPEQISKAKEIDLLTYLQRCDPHELVHVGGATYCTREHDSLKISNGKWHWFSRGIGGKTALDYLIKVQGIPFTEAVEVLVGQVVFHSRAPKAPLKEPAPRKLLLPQASRYAALRGITSDYKGEASGSDKRYSFCIADHSRTGSVHLFESAIDLLSYATLLKMKGMDWQKDALLSLAGVFKLKRKGVVPLALSQYLQDYPGTDTLYLHLDNDEVGREAAEGIMEGLGSKYAIWNKPPPYGKGVNELLQNQLGIYRGKGDRGR